MLVPSKSLDKRLLPTSGLLALSNLYYYPVTVLIPAFSQTFMVFPNIIVGDFFKVHVH